MSGPLSDTSKRDAIRDLAFAKAEEFENERDEARREIDRLKFEHAARLGEREARISELEARLDRLNEGAALLRSACATILNAPMSKREDVQAALLTATQRYDTKVPHV